MTAANTDRPVFLNLLKIRLPVAGWLSILHRASGILLFLAIPWLIYLLQLSLSGQSGFDQAVKYLHSTPALLLWVLLLWSICHHLLAGIRYLLLDIDIGMDHPYYIYSARAVLLGAPLLALLLVILL